MISFSESKGGVFAPDSSRTGAPGPVPAHRADQVLLLESERVPEEAYWHIGGAARLRGPAPARRRLRELLAAGTAAAPVLSYRLAGPVRASRMLGGQVRHARWEPDPAFDLDRHLDYHQVPAGTAVTEALLAAMRTPLPRDRPLWSVLVLHGYRDDEHMLCYRAHHGFQDGVATAQAMRALLTGRPLATPAPFPGPGPWWPVRGLRSIPGLLRLSAPTARWLPRPGSTARSTVRTAPGGVSGAGPHVVAAPGQGAGRQMYTTHLDIAALRTVAKLTGAGLVQVQLAVLAGALRAWAPERWTSPRGPWRRRGLTIGLPVSLRDSRHDSALGNHVAFLQVTLPCAEPDPLRRLHQIMPQTGTGKIAKIRDRLPANQLPYTLVRTGTPWVRHAVKGMLGVTMLRASGSEPDGALEVFAIPPLPTEVPVMLAFLQLEAAIAVSLVAHDGVPGAERLPGLLQQALTELRTCARPHSIAGGGYSRSRWLA